MDRLNSPWSNSFVFSWRFSCSESTSRPPTQWLSLEVFVVGGWGGSSHAGDPNVFCFMLQREPLDAPKLHVACSNQLMLSLVFSSPFFTYPTLSFFLSLFSQSPPRFSLSLVYHVVVYLVDCCTHQ